MLVTRLFASPKIVRRMNLKSSSGRINIKLAVAAVLRRVVSRPNVEIDKFQILFIWKFIDRLWSVTDTVA